MNILFSEKRDMVRTLTHNAESLFSMKMSLLGAFSLFPFGDEKSLWLMINPSDMGIKIPIFLFSEKAQDGKF